MPAISMFYSSWWQSCLKGTTATTCRTFMFGTRGRRRQLLLKMAACGWEAFRPSNCKWCKPGLKSTRTSRSRTGSLLSLASNPSGLPRCKNQGVHHGDPVGRGSGGRKT